MTRRCRRFWTATELSHGVSKVYLVPTPSTLKSTEFLSDVTGLDAELVPVAEKLKSTEFLCDITGLDAELVRTLQKLKSRTFLERDRHRDADFVSESLRIKLRGSVPVKATPNDIFFLF